MNLVNDLGVNQECFKSCGRFDFQSTQEEIDFFELMIREGDLQERREGAIALKGVLSKAIAFVKNECTVPGGFEPLPGAELGFRGAQCGKLATEVVTVVDLNKGTETQTLVGVTPR